MPSSSPYQANDYQAANSFRPAVLPVNDIIKAITAQNQFWDEGAAKVKSVYENALNLNLSLSDNVQIRDQFMKDAEKQITKLSSMDLSDPSVQRQGMNIFTPLFKDEGLMSDDAATSSIEATQNQIRSAMTTENGKFYSDANAAVALDGVYEFKNSKDRMAGKSYLANKKDFKPYYDPSKEFSDIVKNCKGPSLTSTMPGAGEDMYLHTESISGANSSRLALCLDKGLSQRAKDQIKIDGYASYMTSNRIDHPEGKNYAALADDYMMSAKGTLDSIDQNIKDMDGKILAFKNAYTTTKDSKYLTLQKVAEETRTSYLERGKNLKDSISQVTNGNFDFIKKNYEALAEQLHLSKEVAGFAEAFNNEIRIDKYSADAVKLQAQNLVFQESKMKEQWEHDEKMAELEHKHKMTEGSPKTSKGKPMLDENGLEILTPTDPAYNESNITTNGYKDYQKEVAGVTNEANSSNLEFYNTMKRKYSDVMKEYETPEEFFAVGQNGISPAMSFADASGKLHDDPVVQKWASESAVITNKMSLLNTIATINEDQLKVQFPNSKSEVKLATLNDGKSFPLTLLADSKNWRDTIVLNKTPQQIIQDVNNGLATISKDNSLSGSYRVEYNIKGKKYGLEFDKTSFGSDKVGAKEMRAPIKEIINYLDESSTERAQKTKARNELYGKSILSIKPTVFADLNNIDDNDATRNRIAAQFNTKVDNVKILTKDPTTGEAVISIKGTEKESFDSKTAIERLKSVMNVDQSKNFKVSDNEAIFTVKNNTELIDRRTLDNPLVALQMNLERIAQSVNSPNSSFGKLQPGQSAMKLPFVNGGGSDFLIDVVRTQQGGVKYEISVKQKKDLLNTDGTIRQQKGKYYPSDKTFNNTNELLAFINKTN